MVRYCSLFQRTKLLFNHVVSYCFIFPQVWFECSDERFRFSFLKFLIEVRLYPQPCWTEIFSVKWKQLSFHIVLNFVFIPTDLLIFCMLKRWSLFNCSACLYGSLAKSEWLMTTCRRPWQVFTYSGYQGYDQYCVQ